MSEELGRCDAGFGRGGSFRGHFDGQPHFKNEVCENWRPVSGSKESTEPDPVRVCLGEILKLIEDGVLVRSTQGDSDLHGYLNQSVRLVNALQRAQKVLAPIANAD